MMRMKRLVQGVVPLLLALWASAAAAGAYDGFFSAVVNDDAGEVVSLIDRGMDPNTPNPDGQMPLFLALRAGSLKSASALLQQPALKVDATNTVGETPLMMAALRGQLDWCQKLVRRGAAINRNGWTPLHYAAAGPQPGVVAWLVDHGAAIEAASPNHTTPLMMAAGYGDEASVDVLLKHGADVRVHNDVGWTAVDFARHAGRERLAERLSEALH